MIPDKEELRRIRREQDMAYARREEAVIESVPRPRVKMMADYLGPLLWAVDFDTGEDMEDVEEYALSLLQPATRERLEEWGRSYGQWARRYDPTADELGAFDRRGVVVWRQVRQELAGRVSVLYFSERRRGLVADPDELDAPR